MCVRVCVVVCIYPKSSLESSARELKEQRPAGSGVNKGRR